MNVQFSLTASTSSQVSQNAVHKQAAETSNEMTESNGVIRSIDDLRRLENQGGSISVGEEQLIRAVDRAVKSLQGPQTTLDISIHDKTHEIMVKVMNKETGEVIREVPPERTLDLVAKMMELAGIFVDQKI
ncbi:flagellar protein FlaG [Paenibacillus sp. SAF-054]|uniref:flagellar protein FlaG n=1 Tax=unclassified Paenibacillus TaxID=185978 RepID=UPI003F7E2788